ncbi:MAG: lipoyl synthase [Deltaproteobacteria bacterium]|nr:lipoyl synthase [Deltaproteobacteria bacterium]
MAGKIDNAAQGQRKRLPSHLRRPLGNLAGLHEIKRALRSRGLNTVCESARCPNIGECFSKPTATFLILGGVCTRTCGFCSVKKDAAPLALNVNEPADVAAAAKEMGLRHVVVTSVTRDDLKDGGAMQFALTIREIRRALPEATIEVLTPDFGGSVEALDIVLQEKPDVFNHNVETVEPLYKTVRPGADYKTSLSIISEAKKRGAFTKSGLMVGLGETKEEVRKLLNDLAAINIDAVTIGQYLQPTRESLPVKEYVAEDVFKEYEEYAVSIGIKRAYSGPFVRSSYNAEGVYVK